MRQPKSRLHLHLDRNLLSVQLSLAHHNTAIYKQHRVQTLDPSLPLYNVETLTEHMNVPLFPARMAAIVLGSFGVLALVLAAIGIYGVMSYTVAQRTREIGIRVALGARTGDIFKNVVGRGLSGAALTEAPITPRQNGGTMPFRRQPLGNPEHHRRFTCAADGQVANTDYGTLKPPAAQEPAPVKGRSQPHHSTIKQAQGPQQHSSNRGPRHVCARCGSIIAARRSSVAAVAPRLRSTISRAAKPICARRSAFSSRPAHAMPSCAAEST